VIDLVYPSKSSQHQQKSEHGALKMNLTQYRPKSYTHDSTTGNLASKARVSYTYGDAHHTHAVTSLSTGWSFVYDKNGNMTQRNVGGNTFNLS
jgi:hypothetical protein